MFTIFFIALLLWFIGSVLRLAIRATWGVTKIVFSLVVLPVVAIVAAFAGLMTIALPVLLVDWYYYADRKPDQGLSI